MTPFRGGNDTGCCSVLLDNVGNVEVEPCGLPAGLLN